MRAAIYLRVATTGGAEGQALAIQRDAAVRYYPFQGRFLLVQV